ncbi:hypothetical protein [Streptomyces sp. NBC_01304]|uniref:hypothetical protein n=1 Tax=Streptomyces sp. NBC_01304 TaxID=2903818 RepID=UPI002E149AE4|nr:hypothetical protein OG430_09905 [Streptomyces sp. NBC_01304]
MPDGISRLSDVLVHAERPAVLLGAGSAADFVRNRQVPVYAGTEPDEATSGGPGQLALSRPYALANADVIVVVGAVPGFRRDYGKRLSPHVTVVHVDTGDAGPVLDAVTGTAGRAAWLDELRTAERTALDMRRARAAGQKPAPAPEASTSPTQPTHR